MQNKQGFIFSIFGSERELLFLEHPITKQLENHIQKYLTVPFKNKKKKKKKRKLDYEFSGFNPCLYLLMSIQ